MSILPAFRRIPVIKKRKATKKVGKNKLGIVNQTEVVPSPVLPSSNK
jgi:hypothetical protein